MSPPNLGAFGNEKSDFAGELLVGALAMLYGVDAMIDIYLYGI